MQRSSGSAGLEAAHAADGRRGNSDRTGWSAQQQRSHRVRETVTGDTRQDRDADCPRTDRLRYVVTVWPPFSAAGEMALKGMTQPRHPPPNTSTKSLFFFCRHEKKMERCNHWVDSGSCPWAVLERPISDNTIPLSSNLHRFYRSALSALAIVNYPAKGDSRHKIYSKK